MSYATRCICDRCGASDLVSQPGVIPAWWERWSLPKNSSHIGTDMDLCRQCVTGLREFTRNTEPTTP